MKQAASAPWAWTQYAPAGPSNSSSKPWYDLGERDIFCDFDPVCDLDLESQMKWHQRILPTGKPGYRANNCYYYMIIGY